jgi:hypothetical protein
MASDRAFTRSGVERTNHTCVVGTPSARRLPVLETVPEAAHDGAPRSSSRPARIRSSDPSNTDERLGVSPRVLTQSRWRSCDFPDPGRSAWRVMFEPPDDPATVVITGEQLHRATGIASDACCWARTAGGMGGGRRAWCSRGCRAGVPEVSEPAPRWQQDDREDEPESEQCSRGWPRSPWPGGWWHARSGRWPRR